MNPLSFVKPPAFRWAVVILALATLAARAQSDDNPPDNDPSPYHRALLQYKSGKYEAARLFIDNAEKQEPGNVAIELLKARILTEQRDFKGARQTLESVSDNPSMTPVEGQALTLTFGDLALRQHLFDQASKYYTSLLTQTPGDPDVTLKLIYARIGAGDLVNAGKYASELKPLDSTHPSYYFARAALARTTGNTGEEDQDIEQGRTIYGISMTNRYLKTYLEVFHTENNSISQQLNPPEATTPTNAAPVPATP